MSDDDVVVDQLVGRAAELVVNKNKTHEEAAAIVADRPLVRVFCCPVLSLRAIAADVRAGEYVPAHVASAVATATPMSKLAPPADVIAKVAAWAVETRELGKANDLRGALAATAQVAWQLVETPVTKAEVLAMLDAQSDIFTTARASAPWRKAPPALVPVPPHLVPHVIGRGGRHVKAATRPGTRITVREGYIVATGSGAGEAVRALLARAQAAFKFRRPPRPRPRRRLWKMDPMDEAEIKERRAIKHCRDRVHHRGGKSSSSSSSVHAEGPRKKRRNYRKDDVPGRRSWY
eukprot:CAMPEP_0197423090 /NCGR_PEP_ID=MMETSP1170-20131217/19422_1 /TAXON_ID=54406 /ORGANISM="Sarcinochrysis sp, Strain CCMP770" /LENGTH=290 /DNA_ID=CAMNT_0042950481 /DNA_START=48 /DNA_END=920 /DNA_ORIENTATION=+